MLFSHHAQTEKDKAKVDPLFILPEILKMKISSFNVFCFLNISKKLEYLRSLIKRQTSVH